MKKKRGKNVTKQAPAPIRKRWRETLPDITVPKDLKLLQVPLDFIRPYFHQPRKNFDYEELRKLARSIQKDGQQRPVLVRRITHPRYRFELIDGERGLRACQLIGTRAILALVKDVKSESVQFRQSVIANFHRADHTHIEIAHAAQRLEKDFSAEHKDKSREEVIGRVAEIFGHSVPWVYQYLGLLRLCPKVQELMEEGKISFQIGVAMTNLTPEKQIEAIEHLATQELDHQQSLHYVRGMRNNPTNVTGMARMRSPSSDYYRLENFLNRLRRDTEMMLDLTNREYEAMFRNRPPDDLAAARALVRETKESLAQMEEALVALQERFTALPAP